MLLSAVTFAQNYSINCTLDSSSVTAYAVLKHDDRSDTVDFRNGKAQFTGTINQNKLVVLLLNYPANGGTFEYANYIFLSPGVINFTIGYRKFQSDGKIEGNQWAMDFENKLRRPVEGFQEERQTVHKKYLAAKNQDSPDTAALEIDEQRAIFNCFKVPQDYIKANPGSPVSLTALSMLGKGGEGTGVDKDILEHLFASLAPNIRESENGKNYKAQLDSF